MNFRLHPWSESYSVTAELQCKAGRTPDEPRSAGLGSGWRCDACQGWAVLDVIARLYGGHRCECSHWKQDPLKFQLRHSLIVCGFSNYHKTHFAESKFQRKYTAALLLFKSIQRKKHKHYSGWWIARKGKKKPNYLITSLLILVCRTLRYVLPMFKLWNKYPYPTLSKLARNIHVPLQPAHPPREYLVRVSIQIGSPFKAWTSYGWHASFLDP